jgi:hypothetical protein
MRGSGGQRLLAVAHLGANRGVVYASGSVISGKRAEWFAEPWRAAGFTFPCKSAEQSCARSQVTQR